MNRATLSFSFLAAALLSGCATFTVVNDPAERNAEFIEEHSQTQGIAFDRLMRWVGRTYNSAQDVVQYENRETGSLVLKGIHTVSRAGVGIPLYYTATIDLRDERARFQYNIGEPGPSATPIRGPFQGDIDKMKEFFESHTASAMRAISSTDDF